MHWGSAVTHRRPPPHILCGCVSCVRTPTRSRPHAPVPRTSRVRAVAPYASAPRTSHAHTVASRAPAPRTSRVRAVALHATVPRNVASHMSALRAFAPTLTRQFRIPSPTLRHIARTTFYLRRSSSHRQHHLTCLVSPYFSAIGNRFSYFQQYFIVAIFITFQTVTNLQIFGEILPLASIYTLSKAPKSLFRSFLSHPARTTVKLADFLSNPLP